MGNAILLAGLGFGDEGKGSVIDHLTHTTGATLVVRYNGGAQAAHNVITNRGFHHTFAQFGSGTFAGAKTHLSRHMLVNPNNLLNEAKALEGLGFDPLDLITLERDALVTNMFQVTANRLREAHRGKGRHGSCGLGIGETVADALQHPDQALRIGDLQDRELTRKKLTFSRDLKFAEFGGRGPSVDHPFSDQRLEFYLDLYADFAKRYQIVDRQYLEQQLKQEGTVIFEGAQGVLLDQDYGFHPYTTWSDTTFGNAHDLLQGFDGPVRKIGVLRGYMTRHGAGPFPTELPDDVRLDCDIQTDLHNKWGEFQRHFRVGHFDAVLARYALEVIGGVDELAITNLDKLGAKPQICPSYRDDFGRKVHRIAPKKLDDFMLEQGAHHWTRILPTLKPNYVTLPDRVSIVDCIAEELRTSVTLCSVGPKTQHKWPTRYLRDLQASQWNS